MNNIVPGKGMPIPFSKLFMIMKLIIPMMLVAVLHVSGASYGQKVTINKKKAALTDIFKAISEQTGREFIANPNLLANTFPVDVNVKDKEISEFLPELLNKQGLAYTVVNNVIVITKDPKLLHGVGSSLIIATEPPKVIKGWVTDMTGVRLPGATVSLKGTNKGATTDANGYFEIRSELAGDSAEVVVSYTGFITKVAHIRHSLPTLIYLRASTSELDQVQVIAYGTTTKRFSTGNVATVTAAEIERNPVSNPLLALSGRVSGLVINQVNGMPGGAVSVQLRGFNSISGGTAPLYIIDGVPFKGGSYGSINNALDGGNLLDFVNPADIASVDVLKDADATSIYGSRGANGVILITTKKGKPGRMRSNVTAYTGISKVTRMPEYLNLQEYLQMRREAMANDGVRPGPADYDINGTWDTTRYTNWQERILGGNASISDIQGSVSGGNAQVQYLVGGGYHRESPVMPTDGSARKGSAHFNITGTSEDNKFSVNAGAYYVSSNNDIPPIDPTGSVRDLAPNSPEPFNPDGTLNWENGTFGNPFASLLQPYLGRSSNVNGNITLSYRPIKGLDIKVAGGYQNTAIKEYTGSPLFIINPYLTGIKNASARYGTSNYNIWNIEPQLTYNFHLGKGNVETLLGETFRHELNESLTQFGSNYVSDALLKNPAAAATLTNESSGMSENAYNATFGRVKYTWDSKYILTLNGRYDGSSRFGPANRFHFFWSAGGAWIFTQEKAVKELVPFLSFGKLRGSYGTTGNDAAGDYAFLDLYRSIPYAYQGSNGLQPQALFNAALQWEATRKIEGAIDLGFLEDKILVTASYYTNRSNNQLQNLPLSAVTGFSSIRSNIPAIISNNGWEFELRTTNIKSKNFDWSTSLNVALPRNKLVSYPGVGPDDPTFILGKPLGTTRVYEYAGVDPQTGVYTFYDKERKKVTSPVDRTGLIDPVTVKYYGGFQNSLRYKNWTADILFQFEDHTVRNPLLNGTFPPGFQGNQLKSRALGRWQKPGDETDIPKYTQGLLGFLPWALYGKNSDLAYSRAPFLRLKNVSITYQLPASLMKKLRLQQVSLFAQGQNLLTFSKKEFRDFDPESDATNFGPLKTFTGGLKVNL